MEEQLSPVAVTHLLQHTLRSLCTGDAPQWVYAVFWRVLPRNYPPPKWDLPASPYDRTRANRRNWILAWEDGFCNFAATTTSSAAACGQAEGAAAAYAAAAGDCEAAAVVVQQQQQAEAAAKQQPQGLQPELFFKMSHDIYNYGEGLIGKVAADHSHKWVFKEPPETETTTLVASWSNPADSHPRTWEAQFQSGIQTIALIAVREGVVQLGSMKKVAEDLSYVVTLRRKFGYLESIPGVLLPHPSSAGAFPPGCMVPPPDLAAWAGMMPPPPPHHAGGGPMDHLYVDPYGGATSMHIMPSMSSLEALLSKLPSVVPATTPMQPSVHQQQQPAAPPGGGGGHAPAGTSGKEEEDEEEAADEQYVQPCHGIMEEDVALPSSNGEAASTSAAAATAPLSSYFVDVGGKPGEGF